MGKMNALDWIALILVIIGAINWGLFGFFEYDLVAVIFGDFSTTAKVIYDVIGIAGVYMVFAALTKKKA